MNVEDFVTAHLPPTPARVLEIGCGAGELALALAQRGYRVTAIDPDAPSGDIFLRVSFEDFTDPGPFDAVVASRSLHHLEDIDVALRKIRNLVLPGGKLILNEFAWDQMDARTARWYLKQREERDPHVDSLLPGNFPDAWIREHDGLHDSAAMRRALDEHFAAQLYDWIPYIARNYLERAELEKEEQALIDSGQINAIGFRYVGVRS